MKMTNRYKATVFALCLLALCALPVAAHTYQVRLIVDTDMALDDVRAIIMLLNQDESHAAVPLMVTSDGALSPEQGAQHLSRLLDHFKHRQIKVAVGRDLHKKAPPWRTWTGEILSPAAAQASLVGKMPSAAPAIVELLAESDTPFIYLCLGPMTNLADALKMAPGIKEKIGRVIFYGTAPDASGPDWNSKRDPESLRQVFAAGVRVFCLAGPGVEAPAFDKTFFARIEALHSPAARLLVELHQQPTVKKLLAGGHFRIWDELAVIYLHNPHLFRFDSMSANSFCLAAYDARQGYDAYLKLLGFAADSHLREREVVVLAVFPLAPRMFKPDVAPFAKKIIARYGLEEWKACVLTNELHRHLGIYSILGAKMGIRAREILAAPLDNLRVISFAGSQPPLSCLNDGLQVATGASLGRGTIEIAPSSRQPAASFVYGEQKLTLRVKPEIVQRIRAAIEAAVKKYGGLTPQYFAQVRKISIRCWYEFDRRQIFEESH